MSGESSFVSPKIKTAAMIYCSETLQTDRCRWNERLAPSFGTQDTTWIFIFGWMQTQRTLIQLKLCIQFCQVM